MRRVIKRSIHANDHNNFPGQSGLRGTAGPYGRRPLAIALLATLAGLPACKRDTGEAGAVATLRDAAGEPVGTATLVAVDGGVQLQLEGESLPPGPHGFHVHEHGRCDAPSFESAGGHFNPTAKRHGLEDPAGPHVGDLPNLEVGADGKAKAEVVIDGASLEPTGEASLIAGDGTALVIHAQADDMVSDPAGAAGERIACGVIELAGRARD